MTFYPYDDRPEERLHRCTATLISAQDAITSEHCLYSLLPMQFKLLVGSNDLRQAVKYNCFWWWGYNYWATQRGIRPEFRQNDIAFIKVITFLICNFNNPFNRKTLAQKELCKFT
jgi:hypothetical protein